MINLNVNKMMLLGDIHIDDYKPYNITPGFRRNQYLKFAEHINQICLDKEIDCIALLGDTLNRAVNSPEIVHLLKEFLEIISMRSNRKVIHVCGQHDYNCKVDKASYDATLMNLYPEYTTYVGNGTIFNINGYLVALRDWVPGEEADTSFIDGKVNFMLGHVTLMENFGQSIDESKFDVGVFGDIHQQVKIGKSYSIGTPFYHFRIDEEQKGRYGLLDFTTPMLPSEQVLSWHKIDPTDTKYLKLVHVNYPLEEGADYDPTTNTQYKYIPRIVEEDEVDHFSEEQLETVHGLTDNESIINFINDSFSKDGELSSLHREVLAEIDWKSEAIDLDFKLKSISISNYRSIDKLEYDFVKCTAIIGEIGSGKSSFLNSIKAAMNAEKIPQNHIRRGQDYCEINLKLEYQGNEYTLSASSAQWHYAKNGEWSTKSVKDRKAEALEMMPFLNYTDLFIFTSEDSSLLSAMNDDRKSEILAKLYNIDVLDKLCNRGQELLREQDKITRSIQDNIIRAESSITTNKSRLIEELKGTSTEDLEALHRNLGNKKVSLQNEFNILNKITNELPQYDRIIDPYESNQNEVKSLEVEIQELLPAVENHKLHIDEWTAQLQAKKSYDDLVKEGKDQYNDLMQLYNELNECTANYNNDLVIIQAGVCNYCGAKLKPEVISSTMKERTDKYTLEYKKLNDRYTKEGESYNRKLEKLKTLSDINVNTIQELYNNSMRNVLSYNTKLSRKSSLEQNLKLNLEHYTLAVNNKTNGLSVLASLQFKTSQEYNKELVKASTTHNLYVTELSARKDIYTTELQLNSLTNDKKESEARASLLSKYIEATSNTSDLYQSILKLITHKFSNDQYKLTVESYIYRNVPRISISMKYLNGSYYFDYEDCSTAQKCFCDIYFLSRLLKGTGVLIMDEYFKNVPSSSMVEMISILNELNANNLLFSSHHDNLVVNGEVLKFDLIDNVSNIEIL